MFKKPAKHALLLMLFDLAVLVIAVFFVLVMYPSSVEKLRLLECFKHGCLAAVCLFSCRYICLVYDYVLRYAGNALYMRMTLTDMISGGLYFLLQKYLPIREIEFLRAASLFLLNLLGGICIRQMYQYLYGAYSTETKLSTKLRSLIGLLPTHPADRESEALRNRIGIAIVGAGQVGVMLAEDLNANTHANYQPKLFIDIDAVKVGRSINGIPVVKDSSVNTEMLDKYHVQEIVIALPNATAEQKKALYEHYSAMGKPLKLYDYPMTQSFDRSGKLRMREFSIEELLFRAKKDFLEQRTKDYYTGKTVLITGGGGSIGSELCRQIAKMNPKRLIVLDVYENCAYDIQQELRIAYGKQLDLAVEIISVTDKVQLAKVFDRYRPDVVLHAAAHKHVPLMEHNTVEAVKNNVFGTLNVVECCEQFGVKKAIMVSTDKAVNPTNVMGATKRMCEMIFQSRRSDVTRFSCTRFGNVLGSNGSVIPLFKRQIERGGPLTITDKRIIRYFMTIPEASQLVLTSGAMAKNGELYVLDMGKPVKILELAESMIRLSGYEPYKDIEIIETGLRPGEKLYEELLVKTEELDKTDNEMIFIERDKPLSMEAIAQKLQILQAAVDTNNDAACKEALKQVVSTFRDPEEVNRKLR